MSGEAQASPAPELTLTHLDALPTLAPIAVKLLQITADKESSARDVVETLRGDQSLTAKVLSIANSAAMGAPGKVPTLDRAVVLLGFQAVRAIALTVKIFECLGGPPGAAARRQFDRTEFWKHSLGVACAARRLARSRSELNVDPEEAFVAGLLHDLGKVALDHVFPKAYERVLARARETRSDIVDCERAVLGIDHTVAGRHVAKRWGLPRFLQDVIWLHHISAETLTESVASPNLMAVVQLANWLMHEQHIGLASDANFYEPATSLARSLGYADAKVEAITAGAVSDVAEHVSLLGLDEETPETLYLKSLSRANAELGRANTELLTANRRLTAAARYFQAITRFDRHLNASSDLAGVVAAIAEASLAALQRGQLVAFAVHGQRQAIELCWVSSGTDPYGSTTERPAEEVYEWLRDPGELVGATISRAPRAVHSLLATLPVELGQGAVWLLSIVHDEQIAGGVVFVSERDERAALAGEIDELRSFLAGLGLAVGRANAQAAARRLSEALAESNRRLRQMQTELLRTRALSVMAEMAAGAGHELNGPLTVISGRAQMLMETAPDAETRRVLEQIHRKAHECADIVTELMDFARPRPPKPTETDLVALLTDVHKGWLERAALPASRLQVEMLHEAQAGQHPQVFVDREQIRCVLDEVVKNAVDATGENDGIVTIRWRADLADTLGTGYLAALGELPAGAAANRWVEIEIQDTGCGMSEAVAQRVFDPFFSHRAAGRGRGLGLARAHRTVEAHGGRIWVVSAPGLGSTFHIRLPQVVRE